VSSGQASSGRLSVRTLTTTLWQRQQFVPGRRTATDVPAVIEHLIGLQAQDNLPPYLSLAARIDGFAANDLSDALGSGALVRFLTLRGTVHVHTPKDALVLRGWVQPALDRASSSNQLSRPARHLETADLEAVLRDFLVEPQPLTKIGEHLTRAFPGIDEHALKQVARERLPLLQTPPRGQWKRSGAVVYAFADAFLGQPFRQVDIEELVRRYLAAYGPATSADMTKWSSVTRLGPILTRMLKADELTTYVDETRRTLYDVAGLDLAEEDLPIGATLLGTYDNVFLSHADRDRIAPEPARKQWMGPNGGLGATLFVDGLLAGLWRVSEDRVLVEPFATPTRKQQREIDAEVARVEALLTS
jgi:hypothetical protein